MEESNLKVEKEEIFSECGLCGKLFPIEEPHYMIQLIRQKQYDTEGGIETDILEVKAGFTICESCGGNAEGQLKKIFGESVVAP